SKLKKDIKKAQKTIEVLEKKRTRSQAALVEAILTQKSPDDSDVEYFNRFTELIEAERNRMHNLMKELENL
ncbi:MAG: hypothetical protein J5852_01095, partial [Clostridia bacterium]|nr:hypothetical protein [Clostridia bacterium]